MTFSKSPVQIPCSATPSLLFNNLTAIRSKVAFVHKDEVFMIAAKGGDLVRDDQPLIRRIPITGNGSLSLDVVAGSMEISTPFATSSIPPPASPSSPVHQVSFVNVGGLTLLAVATRAGFSIWGGEDFGTLFHKRLLSDCGVPEEVAGAQFARGLSGSPCSAVLCGTSWGEILVSAFKEDVGTITKVSSLKGGHKAAITSIATSDLYIATADDSGVIAQWTISDFSSHVAQTKSGMAPLSQLDHGGGFPCTSIAIQDNLLIAGYASGHVRIFKQRGGIGEPLKPSILEAELAAHARTLTALAIHPSRPTFATVGEDCTVRVWSIPNTTSQQASNGCTTSRSKILIDMQAEIKDRLLTGVSFLESSSSTAHVCVSMYDFASLHVFLAL
jgi:WD40 repeat protein